MFILTFLLKNLKNMITKKIIAIAGAMLLTFGEIALAKIPYVLYPSKEEQVRMLDEADDMIDNMADSQQDLRADAIYHAMRGMSGELAAFRKVTKQPGVTKKGVEQSEISGDGSARGIKMRLFRPTGKSNYVLPILVYFHSGGWTYGGLSDCTDFCEALAAEGKVIVLAVDYGLAPEKQYPQGLDDCEGALEYAFSHAKDWGGAPNMVSVGGEGAGGNLALAAALNLNNREDFKNKLKSIVLYSPVLKAYNDKSESWKEYSRGYGLDGRLMEAYNESYLGTENKVNLSKDPAVSPAHANDTDLKNLPPILMLSPTRDILFDQGKEFTLRLSKLGKDIERIELPGAIHSFISSGEQPTAFNKAVIITSEFLK